MATVKNVLINVKSNTKGIKDLETAFESLQKENKDLANQYKKTNSQLQKSMKSSTNQAHVMSGTFNNLAGAIAGAFTVATVVDFGKQVFNVTAEFQKLEAVLTNTLGSNTEAQIALAKIKQFASETPFSVLELTDSFVKLANQGFKPTTKEMTKLGDLASSTGKSFDQLTEAIIDAQVGEFERLKEFGIRASKEGDKVKFTFKGVKTEVDFAEESIRKYVLSLGDAVGVSGSMEAISKTLGGQLSNLGDTWDALLVSIGSSTDSLFSTGLTALSNTLSDIDFLVQGARKVADSTELVFGDEKTNEVVGNIKKFTDAGQDMNDSIEMQIRNLENEKTLIENRALLSQNQVDDMGLLETALDGVNSELKSQIQENDKLQAQTEGKIIAIEKLIVQLRDEKFVTEELQKIRDQEDAEKQKRIAEEKAKQAKQAMKDAEELAKRQRKLDERMQKLALSTGQSELAFARWLNGTREAKQGAKDLKLELMDVEDVTLDIGKAFDDLGIKTDAQIELQRERINGLIEGFEILSRTAFTLYDQQLQKQTTAQIRNLDERLAREEISQQQYDQRRKQILRREYEQQKEARTYEIVLAGAVASANVWAQYAGQPQVAAILQALVIAETASQLAIVANEPIPEFEKGGEIGGKRHRDGGTIIEAEKGEFVVNRIAYGQNTDAVKAINDGTFDKYINEHYVLPALKLGSLKSQNNKDLADNIAESIMLHARMDDQRIVGHLKMNRETSIDNARQLVRALGSKRKDIRNV